MISFGTKADTLARLSLSLKVAKVLPQVQITHEEHLEDPGLAVAEIKRVGWLSSPLIVRSSALSEDLSSKSLAGHYTSVLDVKGPEQILQAVEKVFCSFDSIGGNDQVLIQPMLQNVALSGVAFSKNPASSGPYILINYDDTSGSTTSVTGGNTNELKAYCHYRNASRLPPEPLDQIVQLIFELEDLFCRDQLDIEFAITQSGELYLLQARPLVIIGKPSITLSEHDQALSAIHRKIRDSSGPHPYLYGSRTIYGIMPDWNPAEIIGVRPKPLAFSLYKEMITDQIWAYQRDNYGYCNLRSFPLLISFHGLPYIDVRVSFNSFIPRDLDPKIAGKLVDYYLNRLEEFPNFHDKIEFEVIYSCYTLDLPARLQSLENYGFNTEELEVLSSHLRRLTNVIIDGDKGLWRSDKEKTVILEQRFQMIASSSLDLVSKIYWLLEDCKRYGTLPFAGLARAGFIAIQLLKSLCSVGILTLEEYHRFLQSLDTVSSRMTHDLSVMEQDVFLSIYGHLRPGTYDVLSPRYDEAPHQYFNWNEKTEVVSGEPGSFQLSLKQIKQIENLLKEHGLNHNVISFFDFVKSAIEGREHSKFIFSRSLSYALSLFKELGAQCNFNAEECSFADIVCIKELYASSGEIGPTIQKSIEKGKKTYKITEQIILPPLINSPDQIYSFDLPPSEPNFITLKSIRAHTSKIEDDKTRLRGSILLIVSADPGFDWIFSHKIGGFITMYGGMNSHMAIRASELGIPAVIGAGETLFHKWEKAIILEIDCANRLVRVIQ